MDKATVMTEINTWPLQEQMELLEGLWDRLLDRGYSLAPTEGQREVLDRRLEDLDSGVTLVPLEQVKRNLLPTK